MATIADKKVEKALAKAKKAGLNTDFIEDRIGDMSEKDAAKAIKNATKQFKKAGKAYNADYAQEIAEAALTTNKAELKEIKAEVKAVKKAVKAADKAGFSAEEKAALVDAVTDSDLTTKELNAIIKQIKKGNLGADDAVDEITGNEAAPNPNPGEDEEDEEEEGPATGEKGEDVYLTVGQEFKDGTAGNDTFIADVAANSLGQQTNTLASGDVLKGGAGVDTLDATLISAYSIGGKPVDIMPTTSSIENVVINAQISDNNPEANSAYIAAVAEHASLAADLAAGGTATAAQVAAALAKVDALKELSGDLVTLNARKMNSVEKIVSKYSDADLLVKNLTTNGVQGGTKSMAVGMEYTGNADTNWTESNMTVLFDQDYLTRDAVQSNSLYYFTQDRLAAQSGKPFGETTAVDGIRFDLDGETIVLTIPEDDLNDFLANVPANRIDAYQGFADLLAAALSAKSAEMGGALDDFAITLDRNFERTHGAHKNQGDPLKMNAPAITLTAPENVVISNPAMSNSGRVLPTSDMYNDWDDKVELADTPVAINVDLEKVGLAADGGGLIIGSMNKDYNNNFGVKQGITVTDTVAGFDEFNVHVAGDKSKNSSLAYLHSTDNTLRKVTIDSKAGGDADLIIGNSHTGVAFNSSANNAEAFKDVLVMDASSFNGDLELNAGITSQVIAKYFDHGVKLDGLNSVTSLNSYNGKWASGSDTLAHFKYDGGNGNDVLNIAIDNDIINASIGDNGINQNANGGNVFQMSINGNAGNDEIYVTMDKNAVAAPTAHNASNITINGGAGDDFIDLNSANSVDYTFVVSFNGNFGTDTIVGFDAATTPATDVVKQTAEIQEFDFTAWSAHDDSAAAVPVPEQITIKVGSITHTFDANAANMTDAQIATLIAGEINTDAKFQNSTGDQLFNAAVAGTTVTINTSDAAGYDGNKNYEAFEFSVTRPVSSHVVSADKVIHNGTATTLQEGGILYVGTAASTDLAPAGTGADILDFTSYGVKGVTWYDNAGGTVDATYQGTTAAAVPATAEQHIYLVESAHHDGVYDVFVGTTVGGAADTSYDATKGLQLVGTIDFGSEQAFGAANFIF